MNAIATGLQLAEQYSARGKRFLRCAGHTYLAAVAGFRCAIDAFAAKAASGGIFATYGIIRMWIQATLVCPCLARLRQY